MKMKMKNLKLNNKFTDIFWTAVWAILFIFTLTGLYNAAKADEFSGISAPVTRDFQGSQLFNLLATGVYYRVADDCDLPPYEQVILVDTGYYGTTSLNYSGGSPSKVYWKTEITTIDTCTRDCNDEAVSVDSVHWHNCDVTGVIGGRVSFALQCADNSPVFSVDTGLLFLKNIKIYEGLDDTLLKLNKAVLKLETNKFTIETVE